MISRLIGGFVAILLGANLIGPISDEVYKAAVSANGSNPANLSSVSSWGATVLKLVPGFFALGILGIGIAITYGSLKDAGIV